MSKTFLIVLPADVDRQECIKTLEAIEGHELWWYIFPSSVFVNSTNTAREIGSAIHQRFGKHFLVAALEPGKDWYGIVPTEMVKHFKQQAKLPAPPS